MPLRAESATFPFFLRLKWLPVEATPDKQIEILSEWGKGGVSWCYDAASEVRGERIKHFGKPWGYLEHEATEIVRDVSVVDRKADIGEKAGDSEQPQMGEVRTRLRGAAGPKIRYASLGSCSRSSSDQASPPAAAGCQLNHINFT